MENQFRCQGRSTNFTHKQTNKWPKCAHKSKRLHSEIYIDNQLPTVSDILEEFPRSFSFVVGRTGPPLSVSLEGTTVVRYQSTTTPPRLVFPRSAAKRSITRLTITRKQDELHGLQMMIFINSMVPKVGKAKCIGCWLMSDY